MAAGEARIIADCIRVGCWTATVNRGKWSAKWRLVASGSPIAGTLTPSQRLLGNLLGEHDVDCWRCSHKGVKKNGYRERSERTTSGLRASRDSHPESQSQQSQLHPPEEGTSGPRLSKCLPFASNTLSSPHEPPPTSTYHLWNEVDVFGTLWFRHSVATVREIRGSEKENPVVNRPYCSINEWDGFHIRATCRIHIE